MLNRIALVLLFMLAGQAFGQTTVDLRTQSKSVDFSNLPGTRPTTVGTALPANCQTGQLYFNSAASPGANLYGCSSTNVWSPLGSGSGSGTTATAGGATMMSQLNDFGATLSATATNSLTIGQSCSSATPCNARLGNTVFSFQHAGTVTATGSTASGLVYIYIDNAGTLTAGSTIALTCSVCTAPSGISAFPSDSIPLYRWSVTNGNFDPNGGTDFRSTYSTKNLVAGTGVLISDSSGTSTVSMDPSLVSMHVLTPPTSSSTSCSSGQFSYDTTYYYVCVANNTWMRAALSSF